MTVGGSHQVREEEKVTGENEIQTLRDQGIGWSSVCLSHPEFVQRGIM